MGRRRRGDGEEVKEQLDLYGGTAPFERDSDTSREAALMAEPTRREKRAQVYRLIVAAGALGHTDSEIEEHLGLLHQTASARRRELVLLGHVVDSGRRRLTRSRRKATVWIARSVETMLAGR
jgi:hypothetical protein